MKLLRIIMIICVSIILGEIKVVKSGQCVWYDECSEPGSINKKNCAYDGPAKNLTDPRGIEILQHLCPQFMPENDNEYPKTCCNTPQLVTFDKNMYFPRQLFLRCPSCLKNFINLFCWFSCSPDQSDWLKVIESSDMNAEADSSYDSDGGLFGGYDGAYDDSYYDDNFDDNTNSIDDGSDFGSDFRKKREIEEEVETRQAVDKVHYAVHSDYASDLFDSCKDVRMSSTNARALDILCGTRECSIEKWFAFLGDQEINSFVPFPIKFIVTSEEFIDQDGQSENTLHPMNKKTIPCNGTCSCQDCMASCKAVPPPLPPPEPWRIIGIEGMMFVSLMIFISFTGLFSGFLILKYFICASSYKSDPLTTESMMHNDEFSRVKIIGHPSTFERMGASLERKMERWFEYWGIFCARHPYKVISLGLILCAGLSSGITFFEVITDPVDLWSAPDSRARQEKAYFDEHFTPFYRIEQLIITSLNQTLYSHEDSGEIISHSVVNPLFQQEVLTEILNLQNGLTNLIAQDEKSGQNVSLTDICFQPLAPDNTNCAITSVLNYFQNDLSNLEKKKMSESDWFFETRYADYLDHIRYCVMNPTSPTDGDTESGTDLNMPCLGDFGGPIMPWVALGGYNGSDYLNATALVITYMVNNFQEPEFVVKAEAWESALIDYIQNYTSDQIKISFMAQRSVQDELDRESKSDVKTIFISYIVMFVYVSVMLGQYRSVRTILVNSKIFLGLSGVIIVLLSVASAVGFYSFIGVPGTLIIIEVVPFLVLAVGVDNIFILVQSFQREAKMEGKHIEHQIGAIVGKIGPSMLLTSSSESLAFFLGALTNMPAVKIFSLYAAMAVFIDFLLQITVFISLLSLDAKREQARRLECCCCLQITSEIELDEQPQEGLLYKFVKKYYAKWLLKDWFRPIVMFVFIGWACVCLATVSKIEVGLDQKISMPHDSYVLDYFMALEEYLNVGAPVYFVVEDGFDYSSKESQDMICGGGGCNENSVVGKIFHNSQDPTNTKISQIASSWLDDYFDWLGSTGERPCCRQFIDNGTFCSAKVLTENVCEKCNAKLDDGRPVADNFLKFLPWFLQDNPGEHCGKGGHAAYGSAVDLRNTSNVGATYFMTYHTVLKSPQEYTLAVKHARDLSDEITAMLNSPIAANLGKTNGKYVKVFAYSFFYVFYEQYLGIMHDAAFEICVCMFAIFCISALLLGFDMWAAVLIIFTIFLILLNMLGMMYFWKIDLNALSLVNLVMTIGISVEFCSHVVRAYALSVQPSKKERAYEALAHMGSSVMSGITLTKLGGIIVLAFSKSQLFQVYYFRMYFGIVLFGALHGLIFLPVLLSYVGSSRNRAKVLKLLSREEECNDLNVYDTNFSCSPSKCTQPDCDDLESSDSEYNLTC